MYPYKVVQVLPTEDYTVYVYFEDGKIVLYDVKDKLDKGIFTKLQDIDFFIDRCTVLNDTLAWDITGDRDECNCIDIDPDTLHALPRVREPEF